MPDIEQLTPLIQALAASLNADSRRQITRELAIAERKATAKRITAQKDPDGKTWCARRPRRDRGGQIRKRRKMLVGFRRFRHLRMKTSANGLEIGFNGRAARIAKVHHRGLIDRVEKGGPMHRYAQRKILGLNPDTILDLFAEQVENAL